MYDDSTYSLKLVTAMKTPVGFVKFANAEGAHSEYRYPNTVKLGFEESFSSITASNPSMDRVWLVSPSGRYRIELPPNQNGFLPLCNATVSVFYCHSGTPKNKEGGILRHCIPISGADLYTRDVIYVADIDMFLTTERGANFFGSVVDWANTHFTTQPTIATFQSGGVTAMEYEQFREDYRFSIEERSNAICGELTFTGPEEGPMYLWGVYEDGVTPFRIRRRRVVDDSVITISGWMIDHRTASADTDGVTEIAMRVSNLFGSGGFLNGVDPRDIVLGPHNAKLFPSRESLDAYISAEEFKHFKMRTRNLETVSDSDLQKLVEQRYIALCEELKVAKEKNDVSDDKIAFHKREAEMWKASFKKLSDIGRDKLEADVEAQQKQEQEERAFKAEKLKADKEKHRYEAKAEGFKFWSTLSKNVADIAKVCAVIIPVVVTLVKLFF